MFRIEVHRLQQPLPRHALFDPMLHIIVIPVSVAEDRLCSCLPLHRI